MKTCFVPRRENVDPHTKTGFARNRETWRRINGYPRNAGQRPCSDGSWLLRAQDPAICSNRRAATTGGEWPRRTAAWRRDLQPNPAEQCSKPEIELRLRSLLLLRERLPSKEFLHQQTRIYIAMKLKINDLNVRNRGEESSPVLFFPCSSCPGSFWSFRSRGESLSSSPAMACAGKKLN